MRFMIIVKASQNSDAGVKPSRELSSAFMKYNEELVKAGVLLATNGLYPSSSGVRISYSEPEGKPKITDGPFTEAKELIGIVLIDVKSRDEAIEWALRMPEPSGSGDSEIEVRQVLEFPDMVQLAKKSDLMESKKRSDNRGR